jgi:hypothetical protein
MQGKPAGPGWRAWLWYVLEDSPGEGWGRAYAISSMFVVMLATCAYIAQSVIEDNGAGWDDYSETFKRRTTRTFEAIEISCVIFTSVEIGAFAFAFAFALRLRDFVCGLLLRLPAFLKRCFAFFAFFAVA